MNQLIQFLLRNRFFFLFLFLELISIGLIVNTRSFHRTVYVNASNNFTGGIQEASTSVGNYFRLRKINQRLAEENEQLRQQLINSRADIPETAPDSALAYVTEVAEVINNSIFNFHNSMTINKGASHGLERDMGVVNDQGIVGKIDQVGRNYSTVTSVLNTDYLISAKLGRLGPLCTVKWAGDDPTEANVLYIPRHRNPQVGDTLFTSGFNAIFPEEIPIGVVKEVKLGEDKSFFDITINLTVDFGSLKYVYVITNKEKAAIDSVQQITTEE